MIYTKAFYPCKQNAIHLQVKLNVSETGSGLEKQAVHRFVFSARKPMKKCNSVVLFHGNSYIIIDNVQHGYRSKIRDFSYIDAYSFPYICMYEYDATAYNTGTVCSSVSSYTGCVIISEHIFSDGSSVHS